MQFPNRSDSAIQSDTNKQAAQRELHAKLLSTCHGSTSRSPPRGLDTHTRTTGAAGVEGAGGIYRGAGAWRQGQDTHARPIGGRRGACGAGPRCRWVAAGPGRTTSRRAEPHISDQAPPVWRAPEGPEGTGELRDRPLRAVRLACGDLAGGPPPTGTRSDQAEPGRSCAVDCGRAAAHGAAWPDTTRGARNTSGTTQQEKPQKRNEKCPHKHRHSQLHSNMPKSHMRNMRAS